MIIRSDTHKLQLGERIRTVRKSTGYSQKEFCAMLDIPQSTLSAYETDRMQPTVTTLINIAVKCEVSMDWLCGLEPKETPSNVIILKGSSFTAEIPTSTSPELLAVILDKIEKNSNNSIA